MSDLRLAWRLALRELRGGLAGFRVFLASLTLGVAAIAAVATVSEAVDRALRADARLLLGGDLDVRLVQREPTPAESSYLRANAAAVSEIVEMRAMARPETGAERQAMVELKAVDAAYPLLGAVQSDPAGSLPSMLERREGVWGALADATLATRLDLAPGGRVRVGDAVFELRGTVVREPDRVASVAVFGPRLLISAEALAATGLVQPGSLYRHATRVLLPAAATPEVFGATIRDAFPQAGWQIRGGRDAAPGVDRFVDRLSMFLGFAGLTALLIGGLGVANSVRHYLDGKADSIAVLKCVGASGGTVVSTYLMQVMILAALGTVAGLLLGALLPILGMQLLQPLLPVPVAAGVYPGALATAAGLGLLTALAFSLWPLGRAREVPAGNLFRQSVAGIDARPRPAYAIATGVAAAALAAVTILATEDRTFGAVFVAGAAATLLVLRAGAVGVGWLARRLPRARNALVRLAVDGLRRPGAPTATVLTSLGAGLAVLVAVALIDSNLRAQIGERLPTTVPAFFFIDIQDDQAAAFDRTVAAVPGVGDLQRMPSLRGRIVAIDGVPAEAATIDPEVAWAVRGDRGVTFAATPAEGTRVVEGEWWPEDYAGPPLISLEANIARGFGIGVGDSLTVNVLGRDIEARVASLRAIEWQAVPLDFSIVFSPATLQGAPFSHIAAVYAPVEAEAALERAVAAEFANVTAIRTRDAIEAVTGMIERIGWGVRTAAGITILAGALVLAGAVAADRRRREYEAVLFKVLGATRRRIAAIYAVEYGLLGAVTALVAAALGTAVAWAVTTLLMDFEWTLDPGVIAATVGIGVVLTLALGFAGTWRRLGGRTAAMLRND